MKSWEDSVVKPSHVSDCIVGRQHRYCSQKTKISSLVKAEHAEEHDAAVLFTVHTAYVSAHGRKLRAVWRKTQYW